LFNSVLRAAARTPQQLGVPLQVDRPAFVTGDAFAYPFPALAVAVEVAMLDLDSRPVGRLGDEAHLHLARFRRVGLDLPGRADVPAEHRAVRWLIGEHAGPTPLAAVYAAVVDVAADAGFEHGLGHLDLKQAVLARLDAVEVAGEDLEGAFDRRLDDDRGLH
jgi:hypothetical protein